MCNDDLISIDSRRCTPLNNGLRPHKPTRQRPSTADPLDIRPRPLPPVIRHSNEHMSRRHLAEDHQKLGCCHSAAAQCQQSYVRDGAPAANLSDPVRPALPRR